MAFVTMPSNTSPSSLDVSRHGLQRASALLNGNSHPTCNQLNYLELVSNIELHVLSTMLAKSEYPFLILVRPLLRSYTFMLFPRMQHYNKIPPAGPGHVKGTLPNDLL